MSEEITLERQAREAVAAELSKKSGAAAAVMGSLIARASRSATDPHAAVVDVCRGGMGALLLAGQDLPASAVQILEILPNLSLMMRSGPEQLMTWVMEGIAAAAAMSSPDVQESIKTRIDEKFMGAGDVFGSFCEKARQSAKGGS